jgi:Domain of unknown function (DUF4129)
VVGSGSAKARAFAVLVLATLASVPLTGSRAIASSGPVISPEAFEARLEHARALAAAGAAHPSEAAMAEVRSALGLPVEIRLSGGTVTVEPDPLIQGLGGSSAWEFRRATARIDALEAGVRAAEGTSAVEESRLRQALARSMTGVSSGPSLAQRVQRVIIHVVRWLVSRLASVHGAGSLVAWLIVTGLLAGVLLLARTFGLGVVPDGRVRGVSVTAQAVGPAEWRRLSEAALAAGDRVGAVRCLYHAMAASLDVRGVVASTSALTAGEFRAAVRAAVPLLAEPMDEATRVFERAVYGLREPDDEEVEAVARAERSLRVP